MASGAMENQDQHMNVILRKKELKWANFTEIEQILCWHKKIRDNWNGRMLTCRGEHN